MLWPILYGGGAELLRAECMIFWVAKKVFPVHTHTHTICDILILAATYITMSCLVVFQVLPWCLDILN